MFLIQIFWHDLYQQTTFLLLFSHMMMMMMTKKHDNRFITEHHLSFGRFSKLTHTHTSCQLLPSTFTWDVTHIWLCDIVIICWFYIHVIFIKRYTCYYKEMYLWVPDKYYYYRMHVCVLIKGKRKNIYLQHYLIIFVIFFCCICNVVIFEQW